MNIMTIEYAQIISTLDQRPETTDPVPVFMDQNDSISGIEHTNTHPADIRIAESGTYVVIAAPQIGRLSGNGSGHVDFWLRKNGTDIPNSTVRGVVDSDGYKDVLVNQCLMALTKRLQITLNLAIKIRTLGRLRSLKLMRL